MSPSNVDRASESMVAPPCGAAGANPTTQLPSYRRKALACLSNTFSPIIGSIMAQPFSINAASLPPCPAHSAVALSPMSQHWPSGGAGGGAEASPSIAGCKSASIFACASLTKTSFWDWPATMRMLWAAQRFWLGGRIEECLRAIGPAQPMERWLKDRAYGGRRAGNQPALPLDHYTARFGQGGPDQCDARKRVLLGNRANPFGPGTRFAKAASGQHQPDQPATIRG